MASALASILTTPWRVAILQAYADRACAHITFHDYEFDLLDVAHVVAALALVGAVVHHFDGRQETGATYLMAIDSAAHAAGIEIFPELAAAPRLFDDRQLESMLRNLYVETLIDGVHYLSTWLLSAIGWDSAPKEFADLMNPTAR